MKKKFISTDLTCIEVLVKHIGESGVLWEYSCCGISAAASISFGVV